MWVNTTVTNRIVFKKSLTVDTDLIKLDAPTIAKKAKAGQFVIVRADDSSERIPLTLVDWNGEEGTITLVLQKVGVSTKKLGAINVGETVHDLVGPLGNPAEVKMYGKTCIIGGGIGIAAAFPRAKALRDEGNDITSIIGARSTELLIFEDAMKSVSDQLFITTDDGSKGQTGFVSDVLRKLLESGTTFDLIFTVGPAPMMNTVSEITKPYGIKTIVSLNSLMVDGTGMCGCCRVSINNVTKFTCLDGPEFDGHSVDFSELISRLNTYNEEERLALIHYKREVST